MINWWAVLIGGALALLLDTFRHFRRPRCDHLNTACLHGDAITNYMKVYIFRWWKPEVIRRQICTDCGKPLDRPAICAVIGGNLHEWHGTWEY